MNNQRQNNNGMFHKSLKFPIFLENDITLYLNLVDEYFTLSGIENSIQKFQILVLHLPSDVTSRLRNIILHRPPNRPFFNLKQEIIKLYSVPSFEKVTQLETVSFQGSCRDMFFEIKKITEQMNLPDNYLKDVYFNKLPNDLKLQALQLPEDVNLSQAVHKLEIANSLLKSKNTNLHDNVSVKIDDLDLKLRQIADNLTLLQAKPSSNFNTPAYVYSKPINVPNKSFPFNPQPVNNLHNIVPSQPIPICFYHHTYGDRAQRCQPPCYYQKN